MDYEVTVETATARRLAALNIRSPQKLLPTLIPPTYDKVYAALAGVDKAHLAHNVVFYPDGAGLMTDEGAAVSVGVEMTSPVAVPPALVETQTPAGRVAHVTHWGEYAKLAAAHQALHRHCAQIGLRVKGVSWEVYGDWFNTWSKVRTDIYYEIA